MSNKTKQNRFKPVVRRIRLNPEQAVLNCSCYNNTGNYTWGGGTMVRAAWMGLCGQRPFTDWNYDCNPFSPYDGSDNSGIKQQGSGASVS